MRRLAFVIRMSLGTFRLWKKRAWLGFWLFGTKSIIELDKCELHLRATPHLARIADLAMAWEVLVDRVYDVFTLDPDAIIVDIGAHIGAFSVACAKKCPDGKIFAFEPHPASFGLLRRNLEGMQNTRAFQLGVSDRESRTSLFVSSNNPAENSITRKTGPAIEIDLISLEGVFTRCQVDHIDLLKLDCEGAEYLVFKDCDLDLIRRVDRVVMEIHDPTYFNVPEGCSVEQLVTTLERGGFTVWHGQQFQHQGYLYASRLEYDDEPQAACVSRGHPNKSGGKRGVWERASAA